MRSKFRPVYIFIAISLIFCGCEEKSSNGGSANVPSSSTVVASEPTVVASVSDVVVSAPAAATSASSVTASDAAASDVAVSASDAMVSASDVVTSDTAVNSESGTTVLSESGTAVTFQEESLLLGFDGLAYNQPAEATAMAAVDAAEVAANVCDSAVLTSRIPPRNSSALSGEALVNQLKSASGTKRDQAIAAEVVAGNVPPSFRQLRPVEMTTETTKNGKVTITICVTSDYLSVGSATDHVRFPLGLPASLSLGRSLNMILPTVKMVNAIYAKADVKLSPSPKAPSNQMETTRYIHEHNQIINQQLGNKQGLIAGHKKDVVLSKRLLSKKGKIAIYGWHQSNGKPIQSLSTVHHANYADYSHGIRLISNTAFINGEPHSLMDLLQNSSYVSALSDEGALSSSLFSN